jgi:16S rRNA (guanine1516-N2)-methyltransferase
MLKIANQAHYYKAQSRRLVENLESVQLQHEIRLQIDDYSITLCGEINKQKACFTHSFLDPKLIKRAAQKNQALLKACSSKKNSITRIIDLTAGWARDSFLLAYQGKNIEMIEYNPLIYHCLVYLLETASLESQQAHFNRMSIHQSNSYDYLKNLTRDDTDCIYLDPMFPAHKSNAKPGKELQLLQQITDNQSIDQTFSLALEKKVQRVVVKRPLHAEPLGNQKPDISYREKTIRFDVYLA